MFNDNIDQKYLVDHLKQVHKNTKDDFRWKNLRDFIINSLRSYCSLTKASVIDVGCGTGHMSLELLQHGYNVTSIDLSIELTNFTKYILENHGYDANAKCLDIHNLESLGTQSFDAVVCLDVIEHINDDEFALRNINSVLKSDGLLICSVPAIEFLYGIRDKEMGHFRRYSKKDLITKIESAGFVVEKCRYWNFIGTIPFFFSEKILHKKLNENMRYSKAIHYRIINNVLDLWFRYIENQTGFPAGLTLIVIAKKV